MLLADKLVNWTLHGTRRRIDINVSTGFAVTRSRRSTCSSHRARNVQDISMSPAPAAILTGLAPGQLGNLRAWTTDRADWLMVRSDLAVQVRDGLAAAGIGCPGRSAR